MSPAKGSERETHLSTKVVVLVGGGSYCRAVDVKVVACTDCRVSIVYLAPKWAVPSSCIASEHQIGEEIHQAMVFLRSHVA